MDWIAELNWVGPSQKVRSSCATRIQRVAPCCLAAKYARSHNISAVGACDAAATYASVTR